jgi:hypothetical protein
MPPDSVPEGAAAHHHAFGSLYAVAPINQPFPSTLQIGGEEQAGIRFEGSESHFHAADAVQATGTFMRSPFALSTLPGYAC